MLTYLQSMKEEYAKLPSGIEAVPRLIHIYMATKPMGRGVRVQCFY